VLVFQHPLFIIAYVDTNEGDQEFDIAYEDVEDGEINFVELKPGPPYTCKVLMPSDGNNHVETQNDRYTPKTYTFDVTKCDEIFDLLVVDGQVAVPNGLKIPPLKQRKKRLFCNIIIFWVTRLHIVYFSGTWCKEL